MADQAHKYPISKMSQVFGVSRSGYYSWLGRGPSARMLETMRLRKAVHQAWKDSDKRYGSPRIHSHLRSSGLEISQPRIARLINTMGIANHIRRRWVKTTQSNHSWPVAANLLDRNFSSSGLSQVWVSDCKLP